MVILAILVVGALLTATVAYTVDELRDIVIIKTFGKTGEPIFGREQAGLHFKWPWPVQKMVRYEARTFDFEDTSSEVPTRDKQNMLVTMYCFWRIDDPVKFHQAIETTEAAQNRLRSLLRNYKKNVVGKHNMEDFVNTDPEKMKIPEIEASIHEFVKERASADYGIDVVRVGIKALGLPETVTTAVIEAMKEERQKDVRRYESAGEAQATAIRERANSARDQILAFADAKAKDIRTEGDRAAAKYYSQFAENPELSIFLRSLESLEKELSSKSQILLDGSELPAVKFFREGPSLHNAPSGKGSSSNSKK